MHELAPRSRPFSPFTSHIKTAITTTVPQPWCSERRRVSSVLPLHQPRPLPSKQALAAGDLVPKATINSKICVCTRVFPWLTLSFLFSRHKKTTATIIVLTRTNAVACSVAKPLSLFLMRPTLSVCDVSTAHKNVHCIRHRSERVPKCITTLT